MDSDNIELLVLKDPQVVRRRKGVIVADADDRDSLGPLRDLLSRRLPGLEALGDDAGRQAADRKFRCMFNEVPPADFAALMFLKNQKANFKPPCS